MARARNLKFGFFKNADLVELPFETRILFAGLWGLADREGRLVDNPRQIKLDVFPGDKVDCEAMLAALANTGMLVRYTHGADRYIQITNFRKHQNPHRDERPSTIPAPAINSVATEQAPVMHGANNVQPPKQHDAGTVQAQSPQDLKPESAPSGNAATSVQNGLTPDSLYPDSHNLTPDCSTKTHASALGDEDANAVTGATKPGAVCVVLKSEGIAQVNPSHAGLLELLEAGAQLSDFVAACEVAHGANKPNFGYVLGIVNNRLRDAKSKRPRGGKQGSKRVAELETFRERDARLQREQWEESTGRAHPANQAARTIDALPQLEAE